MSDTEGKDKLDDEMSSVEEEKQADELAEKSGEGPEVDTEEGLREGNAEDTRDTTTHGVKLIVPESTSSESPAVPVEEITPTSATTPSSVASESFHSAEDVTPVSPPPAQAASPSRPTPLSSPTAGISTPPLSGLASPQMSRTPRSLSPTPSLSQRIPIARSFSSQRSLTAKMASPPSPAFSAAPLTPTRARPEPKATDDTISLNSHRSSSNGSLMGAPDVLDEVPLDAVASPEKLPTPARFSGSTPKASIFSNFGANFLPKSGLNGSSPSSSSPSSYIPPVPGPMARTPSSSSSVSNSPSMSKQANTRSASSSNSSWKASLTGFLPTALGGAASPPVEKATQEESPFYSSSRPVGIEPSYPTTSTSSSSPNPRNSFLLHNLESFSAVRRRTESISGGAVIRDSFEKVRQKRQSGYGPVNDGMRDSERVRHAEEFDVTHESDEGHGEGSYGEGENGDDEDFEKRESMGKDGVDWQFWGAVVNDYEEVARTRPKDLSKAIQRGIPDVIRGTIWQLMSSSKSAPLEQTYSSLLKQKSPHEKAIQKDLARTFPSHAYFQQGGGVGQENLFNVVKAYSLYDPDVGYTQGLAFIVAALLLNMPDEEAFCVLVRLMESYDLRSHFMPEMPGLQLRLYQFDRLLEELLPVLHLHFVRNRIKSSMYASQWFMTMFSYRFPLSLVYRIFDIVFAEGIEAIFRFSLALMAKNEQTLLSLNFEQTLHFLQGGLFDSYKDEEKEPSPAAGELGSEWKANEFVTDAYAMDITPFMLDSFTSEWQEKCRIVLAHATEMDQLRTSNRNLSNQVHQLESAMANMNAEHVELVRQLVNSKIEREEIEGELVRYKMLYAELAHAQQDAMSQHRRSSALSHASK